LSRRRCGQQPFEVVAAIVDGVEDLVIAALHVDWLQDHELRAELDQPLGIARRILQVDDHCVVGIVRIDLHVRGAAQHLVGAGLAPVGAPDIRGALLDNQSGDTRLTGLDGRQSDQQDGEGDRNLSSGREKARDQVLEPAHGESPV
jgi:hypothetical protein